MSSHWPLVSWQERFLWSLFLWAINFDSFRLDFLLFCFFDWWLFSLFNSFVFLAIVASSFSDDWEEFVICSSLFDFYVISLESAFNCCNIKTEHFKNVNHFLRSRPNTQAYLISKASSSVFIISPILDIITVLTIINYNGVLYFV